VWCHPCVPSLLRMLFPVASAGDHVDVLNAVHRPTALVYIGSIIALSALGNNIVIGCTGYSVTGQAQTHNHSVDFPVTAQVFGPCASAFSSCESPAIHTTSIWALIWGTDIEDSQYGTRIVSGVAEQHTKAWGAN
jgi:hypothetical protein